MARCDSRQTLGCSDFRCDRLGVCWREREAKFREDQRRERLEALALSVASLALAARLAWAAIVGGA